MIVNKLSIISGVILLSLMVYTIIITFFLTDEQLIQLVKFNETYLLPIIIIGFIGVTAMTLIIIGVKF